MYRNPKKGGSYRKNLLARHINMLLFQGEVETIVGQVTQQLGVKGTMYIQCSYIASYNRTCNIQAIIS